MHTRNWLILFIIGSTFAITSSETFKDLLKKHRTKRSTDQLIESPDYICERFKTPTPDKTFFSPIHQSSTYPSNVDCVLKLVAPEDHVIQLDFRNVFNIEEEPTCEYDFLEVRDGKYGFSDNLGRFCGNTFPSLIISSDRYMWLRFHSDDSIEYEGFEAIFTYMPRQANAPLRPECYNVVNNTVQEEIEFNSTSSIIAPALINNEIDCIWKIEVEQSHQISLTFEIFNLFNKNDCGSNFIDIYGNDTNVSSPAKHFCAVVAEPYESKSNVLHIRFFANKNISSSTFKIYYSTFRKKPDKGQCTADELDCDDDTCIPGVLGCNKINNCKFQKDEEECPEDIDESNNELLVIIIIFSGLLGTMTAVFFFNCVRKLIRDQKIIRETIRQSKESKLDEAGRASMKRSLENINRIVPKTTGYSASTKIIPIQDEDAGRIFRETDSPSLSDSLQRINRSRYNYREQLRNILRHSPAQQPDTVSKRTVEEFDMEGLCDISCQTRDSLFATGISSKLPQSNAQPPDTYEFSTFGYNPRINASTAMTPVNSSTLPYRDRSMHRVDIPPAHTLIDNYEHLNKFETQLPPPPPPAVAAATLRAYNTPKKMEESRIMLEIRNSAPDVIIMTSH